MNYRVITYICGCSYLLIEDPEKVVMERHGRCPSHRKPQELVTMWCWDCGRRLEISPQAGRNKKRCVECQRLRVLKITQKNWEEKYRFRKHKGGKIEYSVPKESDKQAAARIVNEVTEQVRAKYAPEKEVGT